MNILFNNFGDPQNAKAGLIFFVIFIFPLTMAYIIDLFNNLLFDNNWISLNYKRNF